MASAASASAILFPFPLTSRVTARLVGAYRASAQRMACANTRMTGATLAANGAPTTSMYRSRTGAGPDKQGSFPRTAELQS